jgi:acetolactate synthase-1/2/3 large subunit
MKMKISDYIISFLEKNNINTLFTITGGFSMHLNDSFGKNKNFDTYYQHHEQACGYSAVGYTKTNNKISVVCTTAGVAATNTISPCLVAYQDSLSILFISGQVKSTESIRKMNTTNMKLRHYAGADCDIISMVSDITKYSKEILNVNEIKDTLITAIDNLINGRPGPVWLSIPVDIQGMMIDDDEIPIIKIKTIENNLNINNNLNDIYKLLSGATRPIIIAGNGIKLANCTEKFTNFLNKYNIPITVTFHGTDLIETNNKLFCGKVGLIGDRAGNFSLQNSDLVICLGCRMAQGIVGYRSDWFAREAKIIYIDNDENELKKDNINYHLKINMDLNTFFDNYNYDIINYNLWIDKCNHWKNKWLFEMPKDLDDINGINPYFLLKNLFDKAPEIRLQYVHLVQ